MILSIGIMKKFELTRCNNRPRYPIFDAIDEAFFLCLNGYQNLDIRSKQLGMMECIRTLDLFFFRSIGPSEAAKEISDYQQALTYGYPTFLRYFYEDVSDIEHCLIQPSTESSLILSIGKINIFSFKGLSDNYQELLLLGEVKAESYSNNYLQLTFTKNPTVDLMERKYLYEYTNQIQSLQAVKYYTILKNFSSIAQKMTPLVYVHKKYFIGYETTKEIEDFFYNIAITDTLETPEWNTFPPKCTFGGIPFEVYVDTLMCFIGFSMKHLQYCLLLLEKEPSISMENILTIFEEECDLLHLIMERNGLSCIESQRVLSLISINECNNHLHTQIRSAAPPFVKISKTQYIRSICGCLDHPFSFLFDGLREAYPRDWDENTNLREAEFRKDLYDLFSNDHTIFFDSPLIIKEGSRTISDIDACMADKISGEIFFFQLKWQDFPYTSNQKTLSRKRNFEEKTMKWVEVINQWIKQVPPAKLADFLKIPSRAINPEKIKLVIIGRFNSNYPNSQFPKNAAWGQWYQIFVHFSKLAESERTLGGLFYYLKSMNNKYIEIKPLPGGFKFREYTLEICWP